MAHLDVVVTDATASRKQEATVPDDARSVRLVAKLVEVMGLPLVGPDGQPMSYRLHHRSSGRQLRDDETLADAGVASGDALRLLPEITAG